MKDEKMIDTYQDLDYPNKLIAGFRNSHLTWDKIKGKIDFSDKVVFDVGCAVGYFLLQAFKDGAKKCIGIDLNGLHNNDKLPDNFEKPLDEAGKIFDMWGFKNYDLISDNWEKFNIDELNKEKIDIIFCMNVIHYWENELDGLEKIFLLNPDTIVLEIRPIHNEYVKYFSKKYKYVESIRDKSHWNGVDFIILKKDVIADTAKHKKWEGGRGIPETIYIFDINGTLDCCDLNPSNSYESELLEKNVMLIPTKKTFDYLRNKKTWVGTWSGMYTWMQLLILNRSEIESDFVILKSEGFNFKLSITHIYKIEPKIIVIGNNEEDSSFAHLYHFDYIDRDEFMNKYKEIY